MWRMLVLFLCFVLISCPGAQCDSTVWEAQYRLLGEVTEQILSKDTMPCDNREQ